jgi:hydroxybutyrate-dimer hydrolase
VNHSSRAYFAALQARDGHGHGHHHHHHDHHDHGDGNASYIEVTNAQHFDAFLGFPGYADRYVPLHVYLIRALNAMHAHLTTGAPLPPSQVVRTVPRGPGAPAITAANVPAIAAMPMAGDRITFHHDTLTVPD